MYRSRVCGCILKSETLDEIFPALESVRRGHRFRSRGVSAVCDALEENAAAGALLTRREREIVRAAGEGISTKAIADRLGLSPRTIDCHRTRISASSASAPPPSSSAT